MYAKIEALTRQQLDAIAFPERANQPEALPWVFYDTQLVTSGTTAQLNFFGNINADKTMSNMQSQGQLPDPQYFRVYSVLCDILQPVSFLANVGTGALADIEIMLKTQRATWQLQYSDKMWGPFPLTFAHASGGATGVAAGTWTAPQALQQGNNGIFDGGFPAGGALVIPPKTAFSAQINFAAAPTLAGGNPNVRFCLFGTLYRRVL